MTRTAFLYLRSAQRRPFKLVKQDSGLELMSFEPANDSVHVCLSLGMAGEVLIHSPIIYSLTVIYITLKLNGPPPIV
jgi:hypothetical protein